ncbi:alpha/beta hydrolase family protein [Agilicoccus flavus]|uniref:alpha/beta hydrolase family protein n=1 Tax=Agilicoccus flavus TaxID=2775968 RepID=UPI001CF6C5CB|nr:alpha/beta family hydrolase [Agilicoccus flavus]
MTRAAGPAAVDLADVAPRTVATPDGPARAWVFAPPAVPALSRDRAVGAGADAGLVVLTHGSGGGVDAPDLRVVAALALEAGLHVALLEQAYRVAGRRIPPRGPAVDEAWAAAVADLRGRHPDGVLVTGGRSFGARVACRGAAATGSDAVLCLAFPTVPPGRGPERTRLPELVASGVPTLVVCGERDPFGHPDPADLPAGHRLVLVPGDHALRTAASRAAVRDVVAPWLAEVTGPRRPG